MHIFNIWDQGLFEEKGLINSIHLLGRGLLKGGVGALNLSFTIIDKGWLLLTHHIYFDKKFET